MKLKPAWITYDPAPKRKRRKERKKLVRGEGEKVGEEGSGKGDEVQRRKGRKERGKREKRGSGGRGKKEGGEGRRWCRGLRQ